MPKDYTHRKGERRRMNCGDYATIIEYRSSTDIDIEFDDKSQILHARYDRFKVGNIQSPNGPDQYKRRKTPIPTNIRKKMHCGDYFTITEYITAYDISGHFDDGTILEHRCYSQFKNGSLYNPNSTAIYYERQHRKDSYENQSRRMNCGDVFTITKYHTYRNIDGVFEDGTPVTHKTYQSFLHGEIQNPNGISKNERAKNDRTNETQKMACGLTATIIKYINTDDITVQFEDGTVVEHTRYRHFVEGGIRHPYLANRRTNFINNAPKCIINHIEFNTIAYQYLDDVNYYCKCQLCNEQNIWNINEIKHHHCSISQKEKL